MLPFGNVPFGQGFFGRGHWGLRVFWGNVPGEHQQFDADNGGYMEKMLKTWADEYEALLQQVMQLPQQRDPFRARATRTVFETMYVTQLVAETEDHYGVVWKLMEECNPSALPTGYVPIQAVGPTWIAEFEDGRWPVVLVRTRNIDSATVAPLYDAATSIGNEVWCSLGITLPFTYTGEVIGEGDGTAAPVVVVGRPVRFAVNPGVLIVNAGVSIHFTGSISAAVTAYDNGAGELRENVAGSATGNLRGTVDYDDGTIALDVDHDVPGELVVVATDVTATYTVRGYYITMRPQSMLEWLHKDFGLIADTAAPDDVQRAALVHYPHYMAQKGNAKSYEVLGGIYLFTVSAVGIWEVCDASLVADFPASHVWTIGGRIYTDIDPRRIRFDDIAADSEFYDFFGDHAVIPPAPGLVPLLDRETLYDDGTMPPVGDGWSVAKGFAVDVTQGYYYPARVPATVTSVVAITDAEKSAYGLSQGYRVQVLMSAAQKAEFNYTGRGRFALTCYDKAGLVPPSWTADPYWIDAEVSWNAGTLTWTIIIGASTVPAAWSDPMGVHDVAVRYWPEVDMSDCCFCRTSYVRVHILPTAEGEAHYGASLAAGEPYRRARERLEARIDEVLRPSHVRVLEFVYTP